jgi:hypothetical protein
VLDRFARLSENDLCLIVGGPWQVDRGAGGMVKLTRATLTDPVLGSVAVPASCRLTVFAHESAITSLGAALGEFVELDVLAWPRKGEGAIGLELNLIAAFQRLPASSR